MQLKGLSQPFLLGIAKKINIQPKFTGCTCVIPCDSFQKTESPNSKAIKEFLTQSSKVYEFAKNHPESEKEKVFLAEAKTKIEEIAKDNIHDLAEIFNYESELGPVIHPELKKMALTSAKENGEIGDATLINCLVHHISYAKDKETKNIAAEAVIKLYNSNVKTHIITHLVNGHREDDIFAAKILGRVDVQNGKHFLFYLAHPRNCNEVRIEALKGLANVGNDMDVYEISRILKEDDPKKMSVKIQAMKTISQIGSPEQVMRFLNPMIDSENPQISEIASELIG